MLTNYESWPGKFRYNFVSDLQLSWPRYNLPNSLSLYASRTVVFRGGFATRENLAMSDSFGCPNRGLSLLFSRRHQGMLLNVLQCTKQPCVTDSSPAHNVSDSEGKKPWYRQHIVTKSTYFRVIQT